MAQGYLPQLEPANCRHKSIIFEYLAYFIHAPRRRHRPSHVVIRLQHCFELGDGTAGAGLDFNLPVRLPSAGHYNCKARQWLFMEAAAAAAAAAAVSAAAAAAATAAASAASIAAATADSLQTAAAPPPPPPSEDL